MAQEIQEKVILEIKIPRGSEQTPEVMVGVFAALSNLKSSFLDRLFKREKPLIFEIVVYNQAIHFYACLPQDYQTYFESQLTAQYSKATVMPTPDYLPSFFESNQSLAAGQLKLSAAFYFPLKTYADFKEIDPLSSVLGIMGRAEKEEKMLIQIMVLPAHGWQGAGHKVLTKGVPQAEGKVSPHPQAKLIEQKLGVAGFCCAIRLLTASESKPESAALLKNLAGSFGALSLGEGNSLRLNKPSFWQEKKFIQSILNRKPQYIPRRQVLTVSELATIFHMPGKYLSEIRNIAWGTKLTGEPPDNLPIGFGSTEEEKKDVNFYGRTEFKNKVVTFGVKRIDRRKHVYIIGKTGTGKSTLIANMAINDMRNGEGLAVIDPHGDLSEILLDFVPSSRINDVVYLDPTDVSHPFHLNFLELKNPEHRELIASGIVAIFYKLYSYSWGPRLEYILRNTLLTLLTYPDTTLVDVPRLLTDRNFRGRVLANLNDPVLLGFWKDEYETMSEKMMNESISSILNKVGQFVASPMIRGIIGHPKSTIDLEDIMNNGKILILNLSSGKMGEDNSALMGAMLISKIQLAAMNRVNIPEEQRKDFYLYVDEFQNFATNSFVKILSEARKYRLDLTVANQYIAQVPEEIQKAIFGNVGTLMSFLIGAEDSRILTKEFGEVYTEAELVSLGNFQLINKISIDNLTSRPFYAFSLPLPHAQNQNREKIIRISQERYCRPASEPVIYSRTPEVSPVPQSQPVQNRPPIQTQRPFNRDNFHKPYSSFRPRPGGPPPSSPPNPPSGPPKQEQK
ncbi:MAG: type IV secretion system DNA-binding domain-containing protein [bacterium]|nr:type IV secretion system DNA-binding domain-containing protein [bacterium]